MYDLIVDFPSERSIKKRESDESMRISNLYSLNRQQAATDSHPDSTRTIASKQVALAGSLGTVARSSSLPPHDSL